MESTWDVSLPSTLPLPSALSVSKINKNLKENIGVSMLILLIATNTIINARYNNRRKWVYEDSVGTSQFFCKSKTDLQNKVCFLKKERFAMLAFSSH